MGRHLKNRELTSASYSIRAPYGYSAVGPNSPVDGLFRINGDTAKLEYYSSGSWRIIAIEGTVSVTKDSYMGDGTLRDFGPMLVSYQAGQEADMLVFIGNVFQNPGVAYTVLGDIISFVAPPNLGQPVIILHGYASTVVAL